MKIRIVSDLHVDVNDTLDFGFLDDNTVDLTLIAGDIGGGWHVEKQLIDRLNTDTIIVGGNHLGYNWNQYDNPLTETKESCLKQLCSISKVNYLENQYVEVGDYIIFGGTMYSNFLLYGRNCKNFCKKSAERWLNDFRYVHTFDVKNGVIRPVTTDDYEQWFKDFKKELRKCIKETDKDIIVLTHFAPSIKSIAGKYLNREERFNSPGSHLNAVYANNLESFIKKNERIKYWIHGHVHDPFDYNIGQCRVLCEPYGYRHETMLVPEDYYGKVIEV